METDLLERSLVDLTRIEEIHPIIAAGLAWNTGGLEELIPKKLFLLWFKRCAKRGSVEGFLEGQRQRF